MENMDALGELQNLQSKRQSMKDKMKKRREAIENLEYSVNASATETPEIVIPEKKPKIEVEETTNGNTDKLDDLLSNRNDSLTVKEEAETDGGSRRSSSSRGPSRRGSVSPRPKEKRRSLECDDLNMLLTMQSTKEREEREQQEEILTLLSKPTAREQSLMDTFRSQDGGGVKEFCSFSTKSECMKVHKSRVPCSKLHFVKILQSHTDESLGDCSFLNTCFHMDTCKYIHYEVDKADVRSAKKRDEGVASPGSGGVTTTSVGMLESTKLMPPQWIQCDLRNLTLAVLGKFSVIMADPPWDIHMELPYGTMSDDEMRRLPVPSLQDDGLIFLWVTGRAMELGRECLKLWGYERVDEIIWVKTNQLQRIIRTGRTGHWLNHGKEHCLVGMKGNLPLNRGLDSDVIVAEVRATSHKPDEIYGIIERMTPGTRKIELFGRRHNVQPNWVTLGNQLDGVVIHDPEMLESWNTHYPDGYNITEDFILHARQVP